MSEIPMVLIITAEAEVTHPTDDVDDTEQETEQ